MALTVNEDAILESIHIHAGTFQLITTTLTRLLQLKAIINVDMELEVTLKNQTIKVLG